MSVYNQEKEHLSPVLPLFSLWVCSELLVVSCPSWLEDFDGGSPSRDRERDLDLDPRDRDLDLDRGDLDLDLVPLEPDWERESASATGSFLAGR